MPTPTVARSRSPASDLINGDRALTSSALSSTLAISIPTTDPCDLSSKLPAHDGRFPMPSAALESNGGAMREGAEREGSLESDGSIPPLPASDRGAQRQSTTPPPPPPRSHGLSSQSQPCASSHNVSPSLEQRPFEMAGARARPTTTSSFLRPFSRFTGTQKSDKSTYRVEVELKYVDMAQSSLCGFLQIEGLTENLPTITTYFEGELIGSKYSFKTNHPSWGATKETDMQHWSKFEEFRPLAAAAKKHHGGDLEAAAAAAQDETIFMRWKEQFLVPDHQRTDLPGASFEGFYYIVFNRRSGSIGGIYFHGKSERYQKLDLECATARSGARFSTAAIEFR